ncbi:MAG: arsenate reductase ArsC [Deltaproteobacteria bacterium]|nr:arsenate reductase ArsC [Deltaproteobacteria bacterium]
MVARKNILFVCVGNTCRSQMAEGFGRLLANGRFEAASAGTSAFGHVNGQTIAAMSEAGVDISRQTSKQLTDEMIASADIVVTLGCIPAGELCPASFNGVKLDWKIEDPLGRPPDVIRRVRDDIKKRVEYLFEGEAGHAGQGG